MHITGEMIIGRHSVRGAGDPLHAIAAATGERLEPAFGAGTPADVDTACRAAEAAFDPYRALPVARRAEWLEAIAHGLLSTGDALIERAHRETGLPRPRLEGERARTANQLRLFAQSLRDGNGYGAVIDPAQPDRKPTARAGIRQRLIPLGPVAVFGASNFPLAFSVAGGDTAAALAAGCPVVVKAHPAHLGTSEYVARVVQQAAIDTGMPDGVFSMLIGAGNRIGEALVAHPSIRAVGFTGSRRGGLALLRIAQARAEPIPVYAEMSSINPVFLLPSALSRRAPSVARGLVESVTLGTGQFCTNPGVVLAIEGSALDAFLAQAAQLLRDKPATTMLTPGIHQAYLDGLAQLDRIDAVEQLARGGAAGGRFDACPALYRTSAHAFVGDATISEEIFGPCSIVVACRDTAEMLATARQLPGQLTATIHADTADLALARELLPILERKAGRILFDDFPTGVEVGHAMVHGGPFPATSDARSTSVGATAIQRFLRPVCYQDVPEALLDPSLQASNPLGIWRQVDGVFTRGPSPA